MCHSRNSSSQNQVYLFLDQPFSSYPWGETELVMSMMPYSGVMQHIMVQCSAIQRTNVAQYSVVPAMRFSVDQWGVV